MFVDGNLNEAVGCFNEFPPSLQWGVIQDYADSVGCHISLSVNIGMRDFEKDAKYLSYLDASLLGKFNTRQEARNEAIEKFNELYNTISTLPPISPSDQESTSGPNGAT